MLRNSVRKADLSVRDYVSCVTLLLMWVLTSRYRGARRRRKGKDMLRVTVTLGTLTPPRDHSAAVFYMSALNAGTKQTTVQRMSFDQLKTTANPFMQQCLRKYLSLPK